MEDTPIIKAINALEKSEKGGQTMVSTQRIELTQRAIAWALIDIAETLEDIKRHGIAVNTI